MLYTDYIEHYGIKGMKWGVRRTPQQLGRLGHKTMHKAKTANFDKWGKSPETNTLYIAGYSGSGKSTVARSVAYPGDTIIHLDLYSDEVSAGAGARDKKFEQYLDKKVPNWRELAKDNSKKFKKFSKEYWSIVDAFANGIEEYSTQQYKEGHRVIVEGIQIADGWLRSDKNYYVNKPIAILKTGKVQSLVRAFQRDERTDIKDALKSIFAKNNSQWSSAMQINLKELSESANAKRGQKSVDEYLKSYGKRRI